jgi:hypothetical protein
MVLDLFMIVPFRLIDWCTGRQHNYRAQASARKDVKGSQLFFSMGVPYQEIATEGIQTTFTRR